jgi:hypothetical protein
MLVPARAHGKAKRDVGASLGLDVLGVTQLGPSLDLEIRLPARTSLGLSYRVTPAGVLSHYIPDLYPGKGKLKFSQQIGLSVRVYPKGGKSHDHAGFFVGGIIEYFRYEFENGHGWEWCMDEHNCWPEPYEIQKVDFLILGVEAGQRWDFAHRFFISLHGVVGFPIVLAFTDALEGGIILSKDRKDADAVPPVGIRLSLSLCFFI